MSQVHSASAESARAAARGRQPGTDPATSSATSTGGNVDFATLFAMNRRSAWLDGLLDRQSQAAAARNAEQKRTSEADAGDAKRENVRRARVAEDSGPRGRVEQMKEAGQERLAEADRTQETNRAPETETQDYQDDRAVKEHRLDRQETRASGDEDVRSSDKDEPSDVSAIVPAIASSSVPTFLPVQSVLSQADVTQSLWTEGATSSQAAGTGMAVQVAVPGAATTGAPVTQTMSTVTAGPAIVPTGATTGTAGLDPKGQQQDLSGTTTTPKAGETFSKSAASTNNDFQSLLTQVGRERAGVVRQAIAAAAKGAPDETIRLARPEAIDQLARVLRTGLNGKTSSMTLRLDPPELGQLRVDIRMQLDTVTLRIQADNQAARDLLDHRMSDLRQALDQHGVRLDRVDVEVRPQTPSNPGREGDGQPPQQDNLSQGGESGSGQASGRQHDADGSEASNASTNTGSETWTGLDASGLTESMVDGSGVPVESGVDLVV